MRDYRFYRFWFYCPNCRRSWIRHWLTQVCPGCKKRGLQRYKQATKEECDAQLEKVIAEAKRVPE